MKEIHRALTLADAYIVRNVLRAAGIAAHVRNEYLGGHVSGHALMEELPTVSVADDEAERAVAILREYEDRNEPAALAEMEADSSAAADATGGQELLSGLFLLAGRLAAGAQGDATETLLDLHAAVLVSPPPFGLGARDWEEIRRLVDVTAAAAQADDRAQVEASGAQLRAALRPFV